MRTHAALLVVLCFFCVPLFVGLAEWDLRNDEAIYSYAVDRILETGDWLTPRSIPQDGPFLEKPPLKFWIVAAAIGTGLLPHDEFGLRFFDALFGAVSFVYVFYSGRLLAGSLCGVVAVLILFTIDPLLFVHGLRDNNMEAALVLAYCGGLYHFARWVEERADNPRRIQALAVGVYFTLGFMTKFVAALFLPIVCAAALLWREGALKRVRDEWRECVPAALLVVALTAPWFVYQALNAGSLLWQTMFGQHVYVRFTAGLDPTHLQPWHFYFTHLWRELTAAGSGWICAIGLLALVYTAWLGRPWCARLVLAWWIVPLALMSIGTSKMFHYTYPFLPPIALGAGLAADMLFRGLRHPWTAIGAQTRILYSLLPRIAVLGARSAPSKYSRPAKGEAPQPTGHQGRALGWSAWAASTAVALAAVALILPLRGYAHTMARATSVASPLQTMRDCVLRLNLRGGTHVYPPYVLISHSYYYYFRQLGPWVEHAGSPGTDEMQRRLFVPSEQTLVIVLKSDYERFVQEMDDNRSVPTGFTLADYVPEMLVTPGPYELCRAPTIAAGATPIGRPSPGPL